MKEGYERGLFQYCPEKEVVTDKDGRKILNGAGAVPKEKEGVMRQRFISIFCPINAVSQKISGDEETLPYVGQVSLLHIPNEQEILIDSEDLQSAFNLFSMPLGWRGMFCYEKKVKGTCLGLGHRGAVLRLPKDSADGLDLRSGSSAGGDTGTGL